MFLRHYCNHHCSMIWTYEPTNIPCLQGMSDKVSEDPYLNENSIFVNRKNSFISRLQLRRGTYEYVFSKFERRILLLFFISSSKAFPVDSIIYFSIAWTFCSSPIFYFLMICNYKPICISGSRVYLPVWQRQRRRTVYKYVLVNNTQWIGVIKQ